MNIDDLVNSIPQAELREQMVELIAEWKINEKDVKDLTSLLANWHGNVWFDSSEKSIEFLNQFQEFRASAVDGIGGLTLNERLYWFGLFDCWDSSDEAGQNRIRNKLLTNA